MENCLTELKENLMMRRKNEMNKINNLNKDSDKNLILIHSGKFLELDFLINCLNDRIKYFEQTKKINK